MESKIIKKYEKKTVAQLLKICQEWVNKYVRLRDSKDGYFTCIACGKMKTMDKCHASHYFAHGHCSFLRFNLDNIHAGCSACNTHLSGNLIKYRINLEKKIGKEKLEWLEQNYSKRSNWDRFTLIQKIEEHKAKVKEMSRVSIVKQLRA